MGLAISIIQEENLDQVIYKQTFSQEWLAGTTAKN